MPATSAEAGPVQLPTNPNFVRTAGVTDASAIEESEKQFAQHVNQELTDVQPQQTSRHTKRAKTGNKDATEFESAAAETQAMPDLEGEADAEMPAADEKAKPPWNGKVIGQFTAHSCGFTTMLAIQIPKIERSRSTTCRKCSRGMRFPLG